MPIMDNEKQKIEEKLYAEIDNDLAFLGEITLQTAQKIEEAGYKYENGKLETILSEQQYNLHMQTEQNNIEKHSNTNEQRDNPQIETIQNNVEKQSNTDRQPDKSQIPTTQNVINVDTKVKNPVLEKICQNTELKIEKRKDKIAKLQKKIQKNVSKMVKLQKKFNNTVDERKYLKAVIKLNVLPKPLQTHFEKSLDRQIEKSNKLSNKINNLNNKYKNLTLKVENHNKKIINLQNKLDGIKKIDRFLNNMQSKEGRRENFVTALTEFNKYSIDRKTERLSKFDYKIEKATEQLEQVTTGSEKFKLRNKIAKLTTEKDSLTAKIEKMKDVEKKLEKFNQLPEEYNTQIDNAILQTTKNIKNEVIDAEIIRSGDMTEIFDTVTAQSETPIKNVLDETIPQEKLLKETHYNAENTVQKSNEYSYKAVNLQKLGEKICPAIDKTVSENFVDSRFSSKKVIDSLSQKFDIKDVKSVIALNIKHRSYDGRVSKQAMEWATKQPITDNISQINQKYKLSLNSHTGLLNIIAEKFARENEKTHTFNAKKAINQTMNRPKETHSPEQEQNRNSDKFTPTKKSNPQSL